MAGSFRQPIAIVGIASRTPASEGPDEFWRVLRSGVDTIRDRDSDRPFGPERGGFVDGIDEFDADFFRMSPREAAEAAVLGRPTGGARRGRPRSSSAPSRPTSAIWRVQLDHPTPVAVARLLLSEVGGVEEAAPSVTGAILRAVPLNGHGTLRTLLRHAQGQGAILRAVPLPTEASRFRPSFASSEDLGKDTEFVVQLASGGVAGAALPNLVCVPSFVVGSGPHQFMRFADRFDGRRDVYVCSLPGFRGNESAPGSWGAAVDVLADSIRRAVGDAPFVLVGYSIGGVIAHSLAARFEAAGTPPAGVVMIDTPTPEGEDESNRVFSMVMTEILERGNEAISIDDENWLAMGTYMCLLSERPSDRVTVPSLLIRAGKPLPTSDSDKGWPAWEVTDEQVDVPADHFALIEAAIDGTVAATEKWLPA